MFAFGLYSLIIVLLLYHCLCTTICIHLSTIELQVFKFTFKLDLSSWIGLESCHAFNFGMESC
jgi:hypothetical protein